MLNTHLLWIDFLLLLGFGMLGNKICRTKIMTTATLGLILCAVPVYGSFAGAGLLRVGSLRLLLVVFGVAIGGLYHAWTLSILPRKHRLFIATFAASVGAKFLGAPMPALATYLIEKTGWMGAAGLPIVVLGILAWLSFYKMSPNKQWATSRQERL